MKNHELYINVKSTYMLLMWNFSIVICIDDILTTTLILPYQHQRRISSMIMCMSANYMNFSGERVKEEH